MEQNKEPVTSDKEQRQTNEESSLSSQQFPMATHINEK